MPTRARIRERFGPEYDRAVQAHGSERRAEAQLLDRDERVEKLDIRELAPAERDRFIISGTRCKRASWIRPRAPSPKPTICWCLLMEIRGYPMSDFEQRAADISVDHPFVVENYRAAHAIAQGCAVERPAPRILRKAMIHYRTLFDEMVTSIAHSGNRGEAAIRSSKLFCLQRSTSPAVLRPWSLRTGLLHPPQFQK